MPAWPGYLRGQRPGVSAFALGGVACAATVSAAANGVVPSAGLVVAGVAFPFGFAWLARAVRLAL